MVVNNSKGISANQRVYVIRKLGVTNSRRAKSDELERGLVRVKFLEFGSFESSQSTTE